MSPVAVLEGLRQFWKLFPPIIYPFKGPGFIDIVKGFKMITNTEQEVGGTFAAGGSGLLPEITGQPYVECFHHWGR